MKYKRYKIINKILQIKLKKNIYNRKNKLNKNQKDKD